MRQQSALGAGDDNDNDDGGIYVDFVKETVILRCMYVRMLQGDRSDVRACMWVCVAACIVHTINVMCVVNCKLGGEVTYSNPSQTRHFTICGGNDARPFSPSRSQLMQIENQIQLLMSCVQTAEQELLSAVHFDAHMT